MKVIWPFDHVTNVGGGDPLTNWNFFFTITRLKTSKPDKVLPYWCRLSIETLQLSPSSCLLFIVLFSYFSTKSYIWFHYFYWWYSLSLNVNCVKAVSGLNSNLLKIKDWACQYQSIDTKLKEPSARGYTYDQEK